MENYGKNFNRSRNLEERQKLNYQSPNLKVYGKAELITQGNQRGRRTDNAQYTCNEQHPEVCNS